MTLKKVLRIEFEEETGIELEVDRSIIGWIEETFNKIKMIVVFEVILAVGRIRFN